MDHVSHSLTLVCGCTVHVSCHPVTGVAHTRIIELRGGECPNRHHDVGVRLWLWDLLPERTGSSFVHDDPTARRGWLASHVDEPRSGPN